MNCSRCGHANPERAKFCLECGVPVSPRCARCGTELPAAAKFCLECGAPTAARPVEPSSERKVVTIVFADLVGSTALHERLDAESARLFMERYYVAMRGAVEAHGGTVTQLLGDGVKAVFGIPRVAEDDAIRAVRAAVEMQTTFRALAEQQRLAVGKTGLRVAVNTGEVVANDASEIIGDPVNVAARLQEQGRDGDVVIGESTQALVAELVTLAPLGRFALKGRTEAVSAYRVESLERPASAAAAAFVGRDAELGRISAVYEAAVAAPGARLAVTLGSPGQGKSRLIDEFARRLGDTATIVRAQCDAAGGASFAPLADALRALPDIERSLPAGDAERARIVAGINALLAGSPASPEETFFVVRRLLAALAAARPVVLVIDDLHWAEPLLLDLIEHLVQWVRGAPLLVLAGARPELRDTRSSLATPGGVVADVVMLAGLDAGAATRLAANVIGATDLPSAVAAKVLATSEGNPLFVGELVRMLVHEGALKKEGDRWITGTALAELEMPPTIQALLASRIERLRPEDRMVLERAAVVGRSFSRSAVAELLPREVSDLDTRLESLRRSELVEPDSGWFLGEPALRFHHLLIRDAAYRRLLKGTRAELHARLADWIEARVGEAIEHDETIGWHLEQAQVHLAELGPLDARGKAIGERAARLLAAAGRRALARDDLPLAAGLLGRALARLDEADSARADLALDWCEALLSAGDVGPAAAAIEELGRFAGDSDRLRAWHICFTGQLTALTAPQALRATVEAVTGAAATLAGLGDAAGEAKAHFVHAQAYARLGKVGACEAALDRALAAARRAGDRRRANAVLAGAPLAALWGPSPVTRASGRCLDVVRVLRISQEAPAVEAVALSCQGVLEALRGRTDAARRMVASSRRMVEELGITHRLLEVDVFAGRIGLLEGDPVAAEHGLRGAYEGLRDLGLGSDAAQAAALLARALLAQGRDGEAESLSHESETLAGDDLRAAIAWRGVRAEALARRGEHGAAIELAEAAVAIAAATDALLDHADARLALAAALRAAGRGGDADAEERRAIELWEAKGATLLAERARANERGTTQVDRPPDARAASTRPGRRPVRANAATAHAVREDAAFAARDADAFASLFADDLEVVDHPNGVTLDRLEYVSSVRALLHPSDLTRRHEPLATLGDALSLCRLSLSSRGIARGSFDVGAFENEAVDVYEVDAQGRCRRMEFFAANHLGDAVARLYERYAELLPDGPARTRAAATARSVAATLEPVDVDRYGAALAPAAEYVDHRTLGLGSAHGAQRILRAIGAMVEVEENRTTLIYDILDLRSDALLVRRTNFGTGRASGGAYEGQFVQLLVFGSDGLMSRWEQFDVDREAEVLARFDELTAGAKAPPRRVRANAATAQATRMDAVVAAQDADALPTLVADEFEALDHKTGVVWDRQGLLASWGSLLRARDPTCRHEPLASLGDSLALCRLSISATGFAGETLDVGAYEREEILLLECDAQERRRRIETFATDHLGDAVTRLYERYAELLSDGPARIRAAVIASGIASVLLHPSDLDAQISANAAGVEFVDHRVLGFESLRGRDALRELLRSRLELSENIEFRVDEVPYLSSDVLLMHWRTSGTWRAGGGDFLTQLLVLWIFDGDGFIARLEYFDSDRAAEALERIDELIAEPAKPQPTRRRVRQNAATALWARFDAAVAARDDDGLADCFSDSFETAHHPSGTSYGRDGVLDSIRRLQRSRDAELRHEVLATLGESLALARRLISASGTGGGRFDVGAYERQEISINEVDDGGRFSRSEAFAPDHMADAVVRLYELLARQQPEGAARDRAAATSRSLAAMLPPPNLVRRAKAFAPGIEFVDNRIVGVGSVRGAEAVLRVIGAWFELVENISTRLEDVIDLRADAIVLRWTQFGTAREGGGSFERNLAYLWVFGSDGLLVRWEQTEIERVDELLARFDALLPAPAASDFENEAARGMQAFERCWRARDWAGARATYDDAHQMDDRRKLVRLSVSGEAFFKNKRMLFDGTTSEWRSELVATRGERLALFRVSFSATVEDSGPMEVAMLDLVEVDSAGRRIALVVFDIDDLDAAHAELDARFKAGEAAQHPITSTAAQPGVRAFVSRDWEAFAALFDPELVCHDHRLLGWGTLHGAAAWIEMQQSLVDLAPDVRHRRDHVRISARGLLRQMTRYGTRDGGAFETSYVNVSELDARGRGRRIDLYDLDQLGQARARFDAIGAAAPPRAEPWTNAATRVWDEDIAAFLARDWRRYRENLSERFRFQDRNRVAQLDLDRDRRLEYVRTFGEMSSVRVASRILGTRGERLALAHLRVELAGGDVGPSEIESLFVIEANDRGKADRYVRFEPDDLDAAYAEIDAQFNAGEAALFAGVSTTMRAFGRAWARRDWAALTAQCAPDYVYQDHRLLGFGTLVSDSTEWIRTQQALAELAPDARLRMHHVQLSDRGHLCELSVLGTREGGAFELPQISVREIDDLGRMKRLDIFDPDQLDQARGRFDAIARSAPEPGLRFANTATRKFEELSAAWLARDWETFARLLPADYRLSDRRRMVLLELDREHAIARARMLGDMGFTRRKLKMLATRGDRLSLSLSQLEVSDGDIGPSETESLALTETNDREEISCSVRFDVDDLDAAYAELDARFDAGEARDHERARSQGRALGRALASRNWGEVAALCAPNFVGHDHRKLGFATVRGPDEYCRVVQSLTDLSPDVRIRVDHHRMAERGELLALTWLGSRDGGEFEIPQIAIRELDAQGRICRIDVYDPGQLEQALARFDELIAAPSAQTRFANAATRAWQQRNAAWVAGDWERFAQLTPIGFRCLDRRRMFLLDLDREQYLEFARSLGESRSRGLDSRVLATRGDRLALTRDRTLVSDAEIGPSESERLNVIETNERGEAVAIVRLDPDDLDAGHAELDARYDAGEAANSYGGWAQLRAFHRAVESRDWDSVPALCAPELVRHDHRLLGFAETRGPAAFVEVHRALIDLAPDARGRYDHVRTCDRGALYEVVWHGSRDGGAFEIPLIGVSELDERGTVCRYDIYDLDQLEQAEARFAELAPDPLRIPPNAATRAGDWIQKAREERDWDAHRALAGDDFTWEDRGRRALISGGIEMWISSTQFNWSQPGFRSEAEVIGTVGDRLALERVVWSGGPGGTAFETVHIRLYEVDEAGRVLAVILYDLEDRSEAFAEAQRRFLMGEAAGFVGQAAIAAFNTVTSSIPRDLAALRECLAPDAIYLDHRILGLGTLTRDAWIESVRALVELAPDLQSEEVRTICWNRHGRVSARRMFGTNPAGGPFENVLISVPLTDGVRIQRLEVFDLDDAKRAVARFEELCASRPGTP